MTPNDTPLLTPPHLLLSVDPGKTNGVSIFRDGQVESTDQVNIDDFPAFLSDFVRTAKSDDYERTVVIVYETFELFRGKALQQSGSKMEASQVIGQLRMVAAQNNWKIYGQRPNIKTIAQMWSKVKPTGSHKNSHFVDAYNHGIYWLVSNNMREINTNG